MSPIARGGMAMTLALLCALATPGCTKRTTTTIVAPVDETPGTILATVLDADGNVVSGATVITNPKLGATSRLTDGLGQVLFKDVPIGLYTLAATHGIDGSARDAAQVTAGTLSRVTLRLVRGVHLEPQVVILTPSHFGAQYSYIDSLNLAGSVNDIQDAPDSLTLRWSSSLDGVLSTAHADVNGSTRVPHGPVSVGARWIVLRATNSQGLLGADSVYVSVLSFPPQLTMTLPAPDVGFRPGDLIGFSAHVSDRETPTAALTVEWRSNLDGVLSSGAPDANGNSIFTSTSLSRGFHTISVSVVDGDHNRTTDSVAVHNDLPQNVVLQPVVAQAAGLLLQWTPPVEPGFAEYHIYRAPSSGGPFTLIDILPGLQTSQYLDASATLGVPYWYRVGLVTNTGAESQSNVQGGTAGIYVNLGKSISRMVSDPARPYLYALDTANNSLLFIQRDSLKVAKTIFIGSQPADLDIDATGTELFVANYGSSEIAVVNLDTQTKVRSLLVDTGGIWDGNPYRICCLTPGRLAWTSLDQWNSIRLIDTQTGTRFLGDFGSYYYPELLASPDGTHFYVCESGSSGSNAYRLDFPGDTLKQTDLTPGYGYSYSNRLAKLSGDGRYLYYAGKKLDAAHLGTEFGTFPELTYAVNNDGSLVVGQAHVYDGTTFAALRTLPIAGTMKVLGADGHTLYSYDDGSRRIYVLDASPPTQPSLMRRAPVAKPASRPGARASAASPRRVTRR